MADETVAHAPHQYHGTSGTTGNAKSIGRRKRHPIGSTHAGHGWLSTGAQEHHHRTSHGRRGDHDTHGDHHGSHFSPTSSRWCRLAVGRKNLQKGTSEAQNLSEAGAAQSSSAARLTGVQFFGRVQLLDDMILTFNSIQLVRGQRKYRE